MRRWVVGLGLVAGLLIAASAAAASQRLLIGSDGQGVRVDRRDGWRVVYTAAAAGRYAQIAGRRVTISCDTVTNDNGVLLDTGGGGTTQRVPAHRAALATGLLDDADLCYVARFLSSGTIKVMAVVAATRRGALFLDQQADIRSVVGLAFDVSLFPHSLSVLEQRTGAVRLPRSGATPPGHRLGLFAHGGRVYAAQRDLFGTLLFLGFHGRVVTTSVFGPMTDPSISGVGPWVGQTGPADG